MLVLLCILAVVAVHRIWHYEDIAAPARNMIPMDPAFTPLLIAPCIVGWGLVDHPAVLPSLATLACYPLLRGAIWVYEKFDPQPECTPCQKKRKDMESMTAELRKWPKRIIVLGSLDVVKQLANKQRKYLFICTDEKETQRTEKNIRYHPLSNKDLLKTLALLIMQGGNATVVTFNNNRSLPEWPAILKSIGIMRGVAWVHVSDQKLDVPAHHLTVASDGRWDTIIDTAKPPG